MRDEAAVERRLEREARETFLGRLGNRDGINVARVEVSWATEYDILDVEEHAGYFLVHATGDEPECEGEEGTIYAVFENRVGEEMFRRQERGDFDGWHINDITSA